MLATVVAEVYGRPDHDYGELVEAARQVKARMAAEEGVVDLDDSVEADTARWFFRVDREKAGRSGVSTADAVQTLRLALGGLPAGTVHAEAEQNERPILLRLPRDGRSDLERLKALAGPRAARVGRCSSGSWGASRRGCGTGRSSTRTSAASCT